MSTVEQDQGTSVSQDTPTVVTQVHAEAVDISQMTGPSLADFIAQHGDIEEIDDSQPNVEEQAPQEATMEEDGTQSTTRPPPPKKRKRLIFANKKLLAGRDLFLLPEFLNQFHDDSVKLCGKIMKCATKKDRQSRFVVDWKKPYPQGLNPAWLKKEHENTETHRRNLQQAIQNYDDSPEGSHSPKSQSVNQNA